ncbi:transglycosylase SLT domain-containing protein [Roseisalinus antarcticus]|uniref:transglycosylase SLT domain-containing protein n=1 Tax=Roseisalinus antarcticus TaxID=254357 RepID=UPI001F472225|nr:transglycosylase SLT domain-containing protein [Roseisalinus antarcticus]
MTVELRPLSRSDALAAEAAARREHLSSVRPVARPAHMLRYPVRVIEGPPPVRPPARIDWVPPARWDFHSDGERWTRAAMSAIRSHGGGLEDIVPRDIATWCPAYRQNSALQRRAFWVGMMSALAKHESTWRPGAVGGNGRWFGLLQIFPDTARRYGCRARTGAALTDPEDNLSCAVRIMGVTVRRDNAIALRDGRWRGVAADWGPMTNRRKIAEMAAWTREQSYCQPNLAVMASLRPQMRPVVETVSTMGE